MYVHYNLCCEPSVCCRLALTDNTYVPSLWCMLPTDNGMDEILYSPLSTAYQLNAVASLTRVWARTTYESHIALYILDRKLSRIHVQQFYTHSLPTPPWLHMAI